MRWSSTRNDVKKRWIDRKKDVLRRVLLRHLALHRLALRTPLGRMHTISKWFAPHTVPAGNKRELIENLVRETELDAETIATLREEKNEERRKRRRQNEEIKELREKIRRLEHAASVNHAEPSEQEAPNYGAPEGGDFAPEEADGTEEVEEEKEVGERREDDDDFAPEEAEETGAVGERMTMTRKSTPKESRKCPSRSSEKWLER